MPSLPIAPRRALLSVAALAAILVTVHVNVTRSQETTSAQSADSADSMEEQVLRNLREQPVGAHTLADFHLPEPYLRRVADRVIRSAFEERFRIVVPDATTQPADIPLEARAASQPAPTDSHPSQIADMRWMAGLATVAALIAAGTILARRRRKTA